MEVHVNGNCIGCGLCASTCPDVFFITDGRPGRPGSGRGKQLPGERH